MQQKDAPVDSGASQKFYTIGEVEKIYGYGPDALRYFEKKGLLHPIRGENNYRYYHGEEFWTLNIIRSLRNAGIPVDQIGSYLQERTLASTKEILQSALDKIEENVRRQQSSAESIREQIETIEGVNQALTGLVAVVRYSERPAIIIKESFSATDSYASMKFDLLKRKAHGQYFSVIGNSCVGSMISLQRVLEGDYNTLDGMFMFDPEGSDAFPEGNYLSIHYLGGPQNEKYLKVLLDYASRNGLKIKGPFLRIIRVDFHITENRNEWAAELQVQIES